LSFEVQHGIAPDDPALSSLAHGDLYPIWQHINHKTFSAAYPLLTMLMFRAAAWLNPTPFFFKIIMTLFDVAMMVVLVRARSYPPPKDISVIVATLNEAGSIGQCLTSLQNRTSLREVIVADGGSTDKTCEIAASYGARIIRSQKGRGFQIKAATEAARGDMMLIVHADCIIKKGMFSKRIENLKAKPHAVGGACGCNLKSRASPCALRHG
jgi:hypothetical protein